MASATAHSAVDDTAAVLGQTFRLKTSAIGCSSLAALKRVSAWAIRQDGKVGDDQLQAEDCRLLSTLHGEAIDAKDGAVCILALGNSRCLWVPVETTEPAQRY